MSQNNDNQLALLTPSESHAFQSFLSSLDKLDAFTPEWSIFTHSDAPSSTPAQRDELSRATRSLLALDPNPSVVPYPLSIGSEQPGTNRSLPQAPNTQRPTYSPTSSHPANPSQDEPFHLQNRSYAITPTHDAHSGPPSSSSASYIPRPSTLKRASAGTPIPNTNAKRPRRSSPLPTTPLSANPPSSTVSVTAPASIFETSPTQPPPHQPGSPSSCSSKPTLLSTSQKKANHIQSEQKRRANIRRGYEALCEIVPALREAIVAEEEAERQSSEDAANAAVGDKSAGAVAKKRAKGKAAAAAAFGLEDGDKMDGRAGPRSEAVVLQKTIEHIGALEARRTSLMARLHHARHLLPSSHPALQPVPVSESVITRRKGRFLTPLPLSTPNGGLTPEELALYDEGCAQYDVRMYEVPVWSRVWDGGTGLPIAGMGLPKGPIKGSGRSGSGAYGIGGAGGGGAGGGDEEDEESEDE